MARFGLWVAALSLGCLIVVVTSSTVSPAISDGNICTQFFDDGSKMTIARVFDMIIAHYISYVPDFGSELVKEFMKVADINRDDRLDLVECQNLIQYIKNRTPPQKSK